MSGKSMLSGALAKASSCWISTAMTAAMATARLTVAVLTVAVLTVAVPTEAQTKLLRFPDLHGDQVVFTYAGDLWLAPSTGGQARRLTAHPGQELFAKFSPDGRWIAFTGQYDGDEQVYVVPVTGGAPRQLTYYPALGPLPPRWGVDHQVYGWSPDGERVLFRSMRDGWDLGDTRLHTVALDGGLPEALAMPYSGGGDFSPDGKKVVYSPLARDFRHWKRYQGGWAQDLYIFDLASHETRQITDHVRSDRDPMWIGDTIYFSSDRDDKLNLYSFDPASGTTTQLTHEKKWDVRWPSADPAGGRIIYELDGELVIYDIASGQSRPISIRVASDGLAKRPARISVADNIEGFALAPKGKRVVFAARGEILTVPAEHGTVRNLTRSPGAHDRSPEWSPDGKQIAFISDLDGEDEIYLVAQDGRSAPRQLTDGNTAYFTGLAWSPDSKKIALRDQSSKLYVVDVTSGSQTEIADDINKFQLEYTWSPDSQYLALILADPNDFGSIHIWSAADGSTRKVTSERFNEYSPSWSRDGKYLYFLSDRMYQPMIGSFDTEYVVDRETYIYALALSKEAPHPFPPRSDEVKVGEPEEEDNADLPAGNKSDKKSQKKRHEAKKKAEENSEKEAGVTVKIDFDGLAQRVARVPGEADNYAGLVALDSHLLIIRGSRPYYGRGSDQPVELRFLSFEDREETTVASGINGLVVSPDGSKMLISSNGSFQLMDASPAGKDSGKPVSTAGLSVDRVPAEEWREIFHAVWRHFRDFFYVENMHGYDWPALRAQYEPLLEHVEHRSDLTYILTEMISELSTSHSYIAGGDYEMPDRPHAALLGARFEVDAANNRYRISEIMQGDNAETTYRSPLTEVGVNIAAGDYLLAINGEELTGDDNPYRLLRHAGAAPVELTVNSKPSFDGSRRVSVESIDSEDDLIYLAWIEGNRRYVEERSDGRLGYLHIPDMGAAGIREFIKHFYSQVRKEGLVIDVRSNGGGNVSQMIIERLARKLLMVDFERNVDGPETYPAVVFPGHMVCLLDEDTASDGDQFSYVFREAGLGPLIGKRSWGGVVGIYGGPPLMDGGAVSIPEAGSTNPQGEWVMEGYGVAPDIEVDNDPAEVIKGRDQQLEKGVDVLLAKIEQEPRKLPQRPAPPVKAP